MRKNVAEIEKTRDREIAEEIVLQSPLPSQKSMLFQIFFLAHDQSQSVEVVETDAIDFGEITQRLHRGESVFIKYKTRKNLNPA